MNSHLFNRINRIPIIGDLSCYIGYFFLNLLMPLALWLSGYKRISCGTSNIWTTKNKKQAILDGIECLRNLDTEMFLRFTKKQRLFIYYSQNRGTTNLFGHFFGLHERYIKLGVQGVACFIAQSLSLSDAASSINQCRLNDLENAALKAAPRKTMEWMQQRSFDPRLINSYTKVVDRWERQPQKQNTDERGFSRDENFKSFRIKSQPVGRNLKATRPKADSALRTSPSCCHSCGAVLPPGRWLLPC